VKMARAEGRKETEVLNDEFVEADGPR
jgi:hypothetical protein